MVRCKAHNLETENASPGSIPGAATKKLSSHNKSYIVNNNCIVLIDPVFLSLISNSLN